MCRQWHALVKHGNTAVETHGSARRVGLSAFLDIVAPLDKGTTIACKVRLAINADKPTDMIFIYRMKH